MSVFRTHRAPRSSLRRRTSFAALPLVALFACATGDDEGDLTLDGSFGRPVDYTRDGGIDAGSALDAAAPSGPTTRVRFVHAFANLGLLTVCHDPDGDGPERPSELSDGSRLLRADFGAVSEALSLPQLRSGSLTLHRVQGREDGGVVDAGGGDAGPAEPCSVGTREATIPLPIPAGWFELLPKGSMLSYEPRFAPTVSGGSGLTLLGSGLALSPAGLEEREKQVRSAWLAMNPSDGAGAELRASSERARLEAAFGPRALLQAVPLNQSARTFSLSLFHAIPNLTDTDAGAGTEAAAVRLCVKADTNVVPTPFPEPPSAAVPFRMRAPLAMELDTGVTYTFRVFVQGDFDREKKNCANTGLKPLAEVLLPPNRFVAGRSYTLALLGAVSAPELCSANSKSFVRPGCPRAASSLGPRLELLED